MPDRACGGRRHRTRPLDPIVQRAARVHNRGMHDDVGTAGYSGTPLAKKLGIADGDALAIVNDPGHARELLAPLPPGVETHADPGAADVILYVTLGRAELAAHIDLLGQAIFPERSLWVAWPKWSSGVPTDMTEDVVREVALPLGLVDNKVCAIDRTWSGLRLVWRKELRDRPAGEAPAPAG